ncbi:MAG: DUF2971 domain-containing protein [Chitinophagales bacterium]|nr:DUF2971 domain-containing protein [Chitinophagales bacterium]
MSNKKEKLLSKISGLDEDLCSYLIGKIDEVEEERNTLDQVPDRVYKFRHFDNPKYINSLNGEIYFANPKSFNDPFDCNYNIDWSITNKSKNHFDVINKIFEKEFDLVINETEESYKKIESKLYNRHFNNTGIFCATKTINNILQWSHYANHHRGFAIEYNTKELLNYFNKKRINSIPVGVFYGVGNGHFQYGPLSLVDANLTIQKDKFFISSFFYKSDQWRYEKEYRFLLLNIKRRKYNVGLDAFSAIYLGCEISSKNEILIKNHCNKNLPHAKIYKAKRSKGYFTLDFELI